MCDVDLLRAWETHVKKFVLSLKRRVSFIERTFLRLLLYHVIEFVLYLEAIKNSELNLLRHRTRDHVYWKRENKF
jgi:hypothetical protein